MSSRGNPNSYRICALLPPVDQGESAISTDTKTQAVRAKTWLKPRQIEQLRDTAYEVGAPYLQARNEAIVTLLYDTGLRVGEAVAIEPDGMLHLNEGELYLPTHIQKDYPIEGESPAPATLTLDQSGDLRTVRTLRSYLNGLWRDSSYLFPSRQSDQMTTESVRNVLRQLAESGDVRPYNADGSRGDPSEVRPHSLRHSVAYRMLAEENARLVDVRNRLRHTSIATTERVYEHFMKR